MAERESSLGRRFLRTHGAAAFDAGRPRRTRHRPTIARPFSHGRRCCRQQAVRPNVDPASIARRARHAAPPVNEEGTGLISLID